VTEKEMIEEIRQRAFGFYMCRKNFGLAGSAEGDWLLAESLYHANVQIGAIVNEEPAPVWRKTDPDFPYGYGRGAEGYKLP
jgi:hypothetical protein